MRHESDLTTGKSASDGEGRPETPWMVSLLGAAAILVAVIQLLLFIATNFAGDQGLSADLAALSRQLSPAIALIAMFTLGGLGLWAFAKAPADQTKLADRAFFADVARVAAEGRLERALRVTKCGFWEWNPGTGNFTGSDTLAKFVGGNGRVDSLAQFYDLVAPASRALLQDGIERAAGGASIELTLRGVANNGRQWLHVTAALDSRSKDEPLVFGLILDVTTEREAERRVQSANRLLRDAIEWMNGPLALWDSRKRLVIWNRQFVLTFQLPAEIVRPGAHYDQVWAHAARVLQTDSPSPTETNVRNLHLLTGRWLRLEERHSLEGSMVTTAIDITDMRNAALRLEQNDRQLRRLIEDLKASELRAQELSELHKEAKIRAEAANAAKTAFLNNMSHELRTPLTAIIGFSEVMHQELMGPLGSPTYHNYVKDIESSGQHLLDLINNILDMAKMQADKIRLRPSVFSPEDAVDIAIRMIQRRAQEKNITLRVQLPELPDIQADYSAVKQMLINILSNAIKFTPENGNVEFTAKTVREMIVFTVQDNGIGIPKKDLNRIGLPFEQVETDLHRQNPGTGLGLALTRSFAELHGGKLELLSEEGVGTTVNIYLPVTPPEETQLLAAE